MFSFVLFCFFLVFVLFLFFYFLGAHLAYGSSRLGVQCSSRRYSCQPTPQPQQLRLRAECASYTAAHGNAGSQTHWARLGIEHTFSWILVVFVSTTPQQELPMFVFLIKLLFIVWFLIPKHFYWTVLLTLLLRFLHSFTHLFIHCWMLAMHEPQYQALEVL